MENHNIDEVTQDIFSLIPYSKTDEEQCKEGLKFMNEDKNRYPNVIAVDKTRVKVKSKGNDYINANFIDLSSDASDPEKMIRMIATQGPVKNTEEDFWNMIFQYSVPVILMLTKTIENQKQKCTKYWPGNGQVIEFPLSKLTVENRTKSIGVKSAGGDDNDIIVSKLIVTKVEDCAHIKHKVYHIQYKGWPDFSAPEIEKIKTLLCTTNTFWETANPNCSPVPLVCHCSAGLGRTGTIAAIYRYVFTKSVYFGVRGNDEECQKIRKGVRDVVEEIRIQRHGMVQTKEQYQFIIDFFESF